MVITISQHLHSTQGSAQTTNRLHNFTSGEAEKSTTKYRPTVTQNIIYIVFTWWPAEISLLTPADLEAHCIIYMRPDLLTTLSATSYFTLQFKEFKINITFFYVIAPFWILSCSLKKVSVTVKRMVMGGGGVSRTGRQAYRVWWSGGHGCLFTRNLSVTGSTVLMQMVSRTRPNMTLSPH
jgi:hypothetical protein